MVYPGLYAVGDAMAPILALCGNTLGTPVVGVSIATARWNVCEGQILMLQWLI